MSEITLGAVIGALAAMFLVLYALARRSVPAVDGAAAHVASRKEHEPVGGSRTHAPLPDPTVWRSVTVSDLTAAEELLDWLEDEGYQERELVVLGNSRRSSSGGRNRTEARGRGDRLRHTVQLKLSGSGWFSAPEWGGARPISPGHANASETALRKRIAEARKP